jgi:subtilisin family serine protease
VYGLSPNDKQFLGWEIQKFDIRNQWKCSQGEGVSIGVIDTGCDLDHPDIKDNLLQGINFVELGKDPIDRAGHGTHTAGTIAASDNGIGMVGIAPKAKIVPIKALNDSGNGNLDDVVKGIIWAVDNKVDFISMSLGSPYHSPQLERAIQYAYSKSVIVFCAAGNSGTDAEIMFPARYEDTISTAAIDENLNRTSFSCSGDSLDFLAPGHNILSCVPNDTYALMSGTSMSSPFVVGCAALLLAYNRKSKRYQLNNKEDYLKILGSMCVNISETRFQSRKYQGYGILNPKICS